MEDLIIVKVGGKVVEEKESLNLLLNDFAKLPCPKILVHGGGRSATAMAQRMGVETKMAEGRRITDADMLEVVTMVYGGLVNRNLVANLQAHGVNAIGLTGADMNIIESVKRPKKEIDYGYVGDVVKVNEKALATLLKNRSVPVIAPLTHDGKGQLLNTNADTIAAAIATAISSLYRVTLTYCFEFKGVMKNQDDPSSAIPLITPDLYEKLKQDNIVAGGMIPKLDNSFSAIKKGVFQVRITDREGLGNMDSGTYIRQAQ
ncbi:acetylglutamate kinase [Marinilabiliaceae bacterium ANBcel2]|nr:acetylglutamate kinase [Marinilabiliaceae bacterium ANBcel2]